jgi:hypothetical protein
MIRRLLRRLIGEPTPEDGLAETLAITIRCARRCAYDLSHAADLIDDTGLWAGFGRRFEQKARHWQSLFSSGASMKDYRLGLHKELDEKDRLIEALRSELKKLGHTGFCGDETPF